MPALRPAAPLPEERVETVRLRSAWMLLAVVQTPITTWKRDARHIRRMRSTPLGVAIELPTNI